MIRPLFLSHGSPMLAIEDSPYTAFLAELGKKLAPKAVVVFTAHWESAVLTVSAHDDVYETIYDFGGFPDELYQVVYPARGSSKVADTVTERFRQAGITVRTDGSRGLDHGSWTLLSRLFPQADVPVVQISVHPHLPASEQYRIGQALQGLGVDDILVLGSGATVHNLRALHWGQKEPEPWAVQFDDWLVEQLQKPDLPALFDYEQAAPYGRQAVPRAEHFVPLLLAFGSGGGEEPAQVLHRSYDLGTLSYLSLQF
ncbi:dioxygenase [Paenibacillus athensensis]|uniref:Dioxygenase n=1 Tax=Paenibacillus athensensis TaxID=1967502 RepID=A0A4Y8PYW9_9BACL|nr:class III extradiol ring-cleavage dioxygenase [Paenibacillus athensensis]MCD1259922.1 dioxygenase [Paenibacillus athensensis]